MIGHSASTVSTIRVQLDEGAHMPERAYRTDAGADLRCIKGFTVPPHSQVKIDTGVHVEVPHNTCVLLVSKSGLNVNHGIRTTGLIDEGFSGSIVVKVYNDSDEPYTFADGDKVSQMVVLPVYYSRFELVDEINAGDRGQGGYGSTGK